MNSTLSCAQTNGVSTSDQMTLAVTLILIKITVDPKGAMGWFVVAYSGFP